MGYLRTEHKAAIESAKIVRDKATGQSRSFGFARFETLEGAEEFIQIKYVVRCPHDCHPPLRHFEQSSRCIDASFVLPLGPQEGQD